MGVEREWRGKEEGGDKTARLREKEKDKDRIYKGPQKSENERVRRQKEIGGETRRGREVTYVAVVILYTK